ncbi:amino acid adenylation domain-containing protein, partial [Nocardia lasii]
MTTMVAATPLPLSAAQSSIWFAQQLQPRNPIFNIATAVEIVGDLDHGVFRRATERTMAEATCLSMNIAEGEFTQRPGDPIAPLGEIIDLSGAEDPWAAFHTFMHDDVTRVHSLAQGPPLRHELIRLASDRHLWFLRCHHALIDGYAVNLIFRRAALVYTALAAGREPRGGFGELAELLDEEQRYLDSDQHRLDSDFWASELRGVGPGVVLQPGAERLARRVRFAEITLGTDTFASVNQLAERTGSSWGTVVTAAFAAYLARRTARRDITVGYPVMNRLGSAAARIPTMNVNLLPLVLAADPAATPRDLVLRTHAAITRMQPHQRFRGVPVGDGTRLASGFSDRIGPVVNVKPFGDEVRFGALHGTIHSLYRGPVQDLSATISATTGGDLKIQCDADADLYTAEDLDHHLQALRRFFHAFAAPNTDEAAVTVRSLPLDDPAEITRLLTEWSGAGVGAPSVRPVSPVESMVGEPIPTDASATDRAVALPNSATPALDSTAPRLDNATLTLDSTAPAPDSTAAALGAVGFDHPGPAEVATTLVDQFATAVRERPNGTAVVVDGRPLSFTELDLASNILARSLIHRDVRVDDRVALHLTSSIEMVIAILGVWKAGAAYVPVDPTYPDDRVRYILEDSAAAAVLTAADIRRAAFADTEVPAADIGGAEFADTEVERRGALSADSAAYVIYTSGSTGKPKGVVVPHRGPLNLLRSHRRYTIDAEAARALRVLNTYSFSFDSSIGPLMWMLDGNELHALGRDAALDASGVVEYVRKHRIDYIDAVPVLMEQYVELGLLDPSAHRPGRLAVGGEAVPQRFWTRLHAEPDLLAFNLYGPTEASVDSGFAVVADAPEPTIGRPTYGGRLYVLDPLLLPCGVGRAGELYIGGPQLARGYHDRFALTAQRFVADPFAPGERLYRTGDLVRWRADGQLEFIGRADDQVKIRGYRVELGEVESALARHVDAERVVVDARSGSNGSVRLVAYLVRRETSWTATESDELRRVLADELPDYMIPSAFVGITELPLGPNGKVDRAALPEPQRATGHHTTTADDRIGAICAVFAEILALPSVGPDDDFFSLGGDSIVSIRLTTHLKRIGVHTTPRDVFECRTPAALSVRAEATTVTRISEPDGYGIGPIPLTPIITRVLGHGGNLDRFSHAMVLHAPTDPDLATLATAVTALLDTHDMLRARLLDVPGPPTTGDRRLDAADPTIHATGTTAPHISALRGSAHHGLLDAAETAIPNASERDSSGQIGHTTSHRAQRLLVVHPDECDYTGTVSEHLLDHPGGEQSVLDTLADELTPTTGTLLRVALLRYRDDTAPRIAILVHHLTIDGVSWRILLDDLTTAYDLAATGAPITLDPVPTSFRRWAESLNDLGRTGALTPQLPYWTETATTRTASSFGRELDPTLDTAATARRHTVEVSADITEILLTELPHRFNAGIQDALLAALAIAYATLGTPDVVVDVEGHGREEHIVPDADLSRTLGWFTSFYPVRINLTDVDPTDPGTILKLTKESLRAAPDNGIGYAILTELDPTATQLAHRPHPEILFNYLGRLSTTPNPAPWTPADPTTPLQVRHHPTMPTTHPLIINTIALPTPTGTTLHAEWTYSP